MSNNRGGEAVKMQKKMQGVAEKEGKRCVVETVEGDVIEKWHNAENQRPKKTKQVEKKNRVEEEEEGNSHQ